MLSTRAMVFFQAEDGIRDHCVTGVQTCALPIYLSMDHEEIFEAVEELMQQPDFQTWDMWHANGNEIGRASCRERV